MIKEYTCNFTADDWQLYDIEGAEAVANIFNEHLTIEVNKLLEAGSLQEAIQIRDIMYKFMNLYVDFGARDSEPEYILVQELSTVFDLEPGVLGRY